MPPVKIYDCFLFFDELEQLEIRLHELNNIVDYFVLCEATRTFGREKKNLIFERNKERFKFFLDRIIYLVFDDHQDPVKQKFAFEREQRNYLVMGLPWRQIKNEDIIILSDVDEIPRESAIKRFYGEKDKPWVTLRLFHYMYSLNLLLSERLNGPVAWRWGKLQGLSFSEVREKRRHNPRYGSSGWHFSCLGGKNRVAEKIRAYSHSDIFSNRIPHLDHKIANNLCYYNDKPLTPVPIDDTFPVCVQNNPERWKDFIYDYQSQ